MRYTALLLLGCFALQARAQSTPCGPMISVVSTDPQERQAAVPLQYAVRYTFDCTVDPGEIADLLSAYGAFANGGGLDRQGGTLLDDGLTVEFEVEHLPNTDYLWWTAGHLGPFDDPVEVSTHFLAYTTAAAIGDHVVSGSVLEPSDSAGKTAALGMIRMDGSLAPRILGRGVITADSLRFRSLSERPPESDASKSVHSSVETTAFLVRQQLTPEAGWLAAAGLVDPVTGQFALRGIRNGSYHLLVVRRETDLYGELLAMGVVDENTDGVPDVIEVTGPGTTNPVVQLFDPSAFRVAASTAERRFSDHLMTAFPGESFRLFGLSASDDVFDGLSSAWHALYARSDGSLFDVFFSQALIFSMEQGERVAAETRPLPDVWLDSPGVIQALEASPEVAAFYQEYQSEVGYVDFAAGDLSLSPWDPTPPDPDRQYWHFNWNVRRPDGGRPRVAGFVDLESGALASYEMFQPTDPGTAHAYEALARGLVENESGISADDLILWSFTGGGRPEDVLQGLGGTWRFYYHTLSGESWMASLDGQDHVAWPSSPPGTESVPNVPDNWIDSDQIMESALAAGGSSFVERDSLSSISFSGGFVPDDRYPDQDSLAVWIVTFARSNGESLALVFDMGTNELIRSTEYYPLPASTAKTFASRARQIASEVAPDSSLLAIFSVSASGSTGYQDSILEGVSDYWRVRLADGLQQYSVDVNPGSERLFISPLDPADSLPPIPGSYLDSDEAMARALAAGGQAFVDAQANTRVAILGGNDWNVQNRFPQWTDRPVWVIDFDLYNPESLTIVLDIESGEILRTDRLGPLTAEEAEDRARGMIADQLGITGGLPLLQVSTDDLDLSNGTSSDWRFYFQNGSSGRVDGNSIGSAWETISTNPFYQPPPGTPFVPDPHLSSAEAGQIVLSEPGVALFLSGHQVDYVLASGGMPQGWLGGRTDLPLWEFQIFGERTWPDPPPAQLVSMDMQTGEILGSVKVNSEPSPELPDEARLDAAFPNPFVRSVTVPYAVTGTQQVTIEAFDALGRRVSVLRDRMEPAGRGSVVWDAGDLAAGLYFLRMQSGGHIRVRSLLKAQ